MEIITNSEKETFDFARKFACELKGGEVIGLIGDLGAGKTVFSKGLARGLGVTDTVTSPTFVLIKVYDTNKKNTNIKKLIHIDAYRLNSGKEINAIGAEEYFNRPDAVTVIEWADKIKDIRPEKMIIIDINYKSSNQRIIKLKTIC